jgi:hypothetical protein
MVKMIKPYDEMTLSELISENIAISEIREDFRQKQIQITKLIDLRVAEQNIKSKVESMSTEEKQAMYTQLVSAGVATTEAKGVKSNG